MLEEHPDQISFSLVPAAVLQEWIHFQHTEEFSPDYVDFLELMELAISLCDVELYVNCFLKWFKLVGFEASSSEEEDVYVSEEGQSSSEEDVYVSEEGQRSEGRRESDQ